MDKKPIIRYYRLGVAVFLLIACIPAYGKTVKALFLGNSYTFTNNLPLTIGNLALSTGDTLIFESNAPGGYTLQQHCTNSTTLSLIEAGNWDYVILQEQSQLPSFPDEQVATDVYPYARKLDSLVKVYNDCAKTVFYVTWGRKNGDAMNCGVFPPVCTYEGMDSLLRLRYSIMAESNNALISPVSNVWRSIRADHPEIELYTADESHPSAEGTYAAACTFYSMLFRKDPVACTFSGTVSTTDANVIKQTAQAVVYDSLDHWSRFYPSIAAAFEFTIADGTVTFDNLSENADEYNWYFGDGNTSTDISPVYSYSSAGSYEAMLVAHRCSDSDTAIMVINISTVGIDDISVTGPVRLYPNPASANIYLTSLATIDQIIISDITGKEVLRPNCSGKLSETINVEPLIPGTYFLKLTTKSKTYTGRFIKK